MNRPTSSRDRGTVYIVVLATMSIVLTLTLSGLINARTELAAAARTEEEANARAVARSALEIAIDTINADPTWREKVSGGVLLSNTSMGAGRFRVTVEDPDDADLLDDYRDPVLLTAEAQVGQSAQKYALKLDWSETQESDPNLILDLHPLAYWPLHGLDGGHSRDLRETRDAEHKGTMTYDADDPTGNYDMPQLSTVDSTYYLVSHQDCFETDYGSVSFWIHADSTYSSSSLSQVAFSKFTSKTPASAEPVVMCMNGGIFLVVEIAGGVEFVKFGDISGDTWHHVAVTWGADGWTAYFDGAAGGSVKKPMGLGTAWTSEANASDIMIGAAKGLYERSGGDSGVGHHFNGKICEAALFAYELSLAQIKELAKATPTPRPLRMDHQSFQRVVD